MKWLLCTGRILLWRWEGKGSGCSHALPISAMCAVFLGMPSACSAAGVALLPITHGELLLHGHHSDIATGWGVTTRSQGQILVVTMQVSARGSEET